MKPRFYLLLLWLTVTFSQAAMFFPVIRPALVKRFSLAEDGQVNPQFRSLLVDPSGDYVYVGAKRSIYKLRLSSIINVDSQQELPSIKDLSSNFQDRSTDRNWWTKVEHTESDFQNYPPIKEFLDTFEPRPNIETYKSLNLKNRLEDYLRDVPYGSVTDLEGNAFMETAQQYSTIYQSVNLTFNDHCKRQADMLSLYYGDDLQMSVADVESLCDIHLRGLTLMDNGNLFAIHTGLFGTMPISATGTNKYSHWLHFQGKVQPFLTCLFDESQSQCDPSQRPLYSPFSMNEYNGIVTDPAELSENDRLTRKNAYLMSSPQNYIGKLRHCDNTPAPNRLIVRSQDLGVVKQDILIGQQDRESCSKGALVQLLLGGYHPDQQTFSHFSASGNGANGDRRAVYVITEIGQEKQQDLMTNYLNLPEIYPLSSSASLAMVRLLIDPATGDVDPSSVVVSNPFKYTWVTSPLTRFGRLDKTGSQEQVAYTPKPVALHEDSDYIYFFFREADWENTPVPSYAIRRYQHTQNSYSQALYFPWDKTDGEQSFIKREETPGNSYEALYASNHAGWQHVNDNLRVTGRVARVSKNDAGLPMGLTDASLFDLDHRLSLNTFQTFVKSRLTCRVPVAGVPFVWRLMRDTTKMGNNSAECFAEVRKAENLYSKDLHYRAVSRDEFVSIRRPLPTTGSFPSSPVLKYFYLAHCKGYRWSYVPKPKTSSALYVEYTELRDIYALGDTFYGVFTFPFTNEQLHTAKYKSDSSLQPTFGSAVCSFSLSDIQSSFNGPFKKRDKSTGNYRPQGREDTAQIRPSPYSRDHDDVAASVANSIKNMSINFLDPTQPYSEEIRNIDLRRDSERLNFFEEDVYGSRTMWDDVKTQPLMSVPGVVFEKVVAQRLDDKVILYVATNDGSVHKILNTPVAGARCRLTDSDKYLKWLNKTNSMSSIWDNEVYAYLNRSIDEITFATSFQSDLTMEKDVNFPDDMLVKSDWNCAPSVKSTVLAVFKPFGSTKTKIWDMKLSGSSTLILATDEQVVEFPTVHCKNYTHCSACSNDPQCSWVNASCEAFDNSYRVEGDMCSCQPILKLANVVEDLILPGLNQPVDLTKIQWYRNDTEVVYKTSRIMLAHDTSLIIFNVTPSDSGIYELRDVETNECLALYNVSLTDCEDEVCRYTLKYQEWCNQYNDFLTEMTNWLGNYEGYGFCSNLN